MQFIRYADGLLDSVHSSQNSIDLFSNIQYSRRNSEYEFEYSIIPNMDKIELQAEAFSRRICGLNPTDSPLSKTVKARTFGDLEILVKNSYIYSYLKVIHELRSMYDTGFNSSFSSGEGSFYYSGHLALLKHGQLKYIQESRIDYSSTIIKRLNLYYSEVEQFLSSSDFFNKLLEEFESTGYFFDTRLENVLDSIRRYYSEIAVVLESNGDFL
jgi:hypothetical protein